ncbi:hypothetical protein FOZ61_010564 [Perkinsus olseni]|uniref:Uncharacterized protein n=1 Tax=Perkinsus olseni TaxID=32597 RepID=A0A7J6M2R0_PEROL|nr:hypothetical protein FOL46_005611 [Perkinsus olseni]KAF4665757.1 hypothetical protein FOZ61_010564 [Perkinsus olseni]
MLRTRKASRKKANSKVSEGSSAQPSSSSSSCCSTAAPSDPALPAPLTTDVVTLRLTPRSHIMEQLLRLADINFKLQLRMTPQTTVKSIVERVLARWRSHVGADHRIVSQGLRLHLPPTVSDGENLPTDWSIQDVVKAYPRCVDGSVTWLVFDGEDDKGPELPMLPAPASPIDTTESCIRGIMESACDPAVMAAAHAVQNMPEFRGATGSGSSGSSTTVTDFSPKRRQSRGGVKRAAPDEDRVVADSVDTKEVDSRGRSVMSPRKKARVEGETRPVVEGGPEKRQDGDTIATALQMSHTTHMALLAFQEKQQEMLERQQTQFAKMLEQQQDWMKSLHGTMLETLQLAFGRAAVGVSQKRPEAEPKGG